METKFRAWVTVNGDEKEMVYNWCFLNPENNNFYGVDTTNERPDIGDVLAVMRFINKKDINNEELYTGDIVRWGMLENSLEPLIRYAVIETNPDIQFRILFYVNPKTNERVETKGKVFDYGSFAYQSTELYLEKVGDVHTTPELLTAKND